MALYLTGFTNFSSHKEATDRSMYTEQQHVVTYRDDGTAVIDYLTDKPLYIDQHEYKMKEN